jgi:hypothetical protein
LRIGEIKFSSFYPGINMFCVYWRVLPCKKTSIKEIYVSHDFSKKICKKFFECFAITSLIDFIENLNANLWIVFFDSSFANTSATNIHYYVTCKSH